MSAVASPVSSSQARTVQQLPLVARARPALKVSVVGQLLRASETRFGTDGSAHIYLLVQQPGDALPFLGVLHADPHAAIVQAAMAKPLQAGAGVLMLGRGLLLAQHEGARVLRLQRCDAFEPVDLADFIPDTPEAP